MTQTIGLLVPDNANPCFAELARTIEDAGFAEGYSVVLCNSDLSAVKQETSIDVLLAKCVEGLILAGGGRRALRLGGEGGRFAEGGKALKVLKVLNFPSNRWGGKFNAFDLLRYRDEQMLHVQRASS